MELLVKRATRTYISTTGDFMINGEYFCHTLEDVDRGITSDMPLAEIEKIKVHGQTAIPTGRYKVTKYFSPKHQMEMPLVNDVPGFEGVEIHVGNNPSDTDGCLLLGNTIAPNFVGDSKIAVADFYKLFFQAINNNEEVWITYQ